MMKICKVHGIRYEATCPSCEHEYSYSTQGGSIGNKVDVYRAGLLNRSYFTSNVEEKLAYLEGQRHRKHYKKLGILVEKGE